jgi:hypothetical protein
MDKRLCLLRMVYYYILPKTILAGFDQENFRLLQLPWTIHAFKLLLKIIDRHWLGMGNLKFIGVPVGRDANNKIIIRGPIHFRSSIIFRSISFLFFFQ